MRFSRSFSLSAGGAFGALDSDVGGASPRALRREAMYADRSVSAGGRGVGWASAGGVGRGGGVGIAPGTGSLRTMGGGGGVGRGRGPRGRRCRARQARRATAVTVASAAARLPAGSRAGRAARSAPLKARPDRTARTRASAPAAATSQRRDVHQQRQDERHPDDADGDDIVPVDRLVAPVVHWWRGAHDRCAFRMRSLARSPIMIVGALVLPPINVGMIDASTTRSAEHAVHAQLRIDDREHRPPPSGRSRPDGRSCRNVDAARRGFRRRSLYRP